MRISRALVALLIVAAVCGSSNGWTWTRPAIRSSLSEAGRIGGGLAVVVFFGVDCAACYETLFEARRMLDGYGLPVDLFGVTKGSREALEEFMDRYRVEIPLVLDRRRELFRKFKVPMVPFRLVMSGDRVVYRDDPYQSREVRDGSFKKCLDELICH